jgi:hypothetical protein
MEDFSLIEKIKILMNLIASSPLFLFCTSMGVAILIFYIISIKNKKDTNKWIFISIWILLALILVIKYNVIILNLFDNLFDNFFKALYFPNLSIYIFILFVTNISLFYSIFNKKIGKSNKIINFINTLLTDLLLIFIVDIVQTNNINVYDELTIYSNSELLVLLELTSALFTSWILLTLLVSAYRKLKIYDTPALKQMPEIVFEEI